MTTLITTPQEITAEWLTTQLRDNQFLTHGKVIGFRMMMPSAFAFSIGRHGNGALGSMTLRICSSMRLKIGGKGSISCWPIIMTS